VAWSPDGRTIADGVPRVVGHHDDQVRVLAFSPDGTMLVSGGRDDTIRVWWPDQGTGRVLGRNDPGKWIEALAVTPDGQTVITGSYHGVVKAWPLDGTPPRTIGRHEGQVWAAAVSADGAFAVTGGGDGCVRQWPLGSATAERILGRHGEPVRSVSISPAGTHVVSSAADGTVQLWDLSGSADAPQERQSLTAVAVDPAGGVYSGSLAGQIRRLSETLHTLPVGVRALAADGQRLFALADDGTITADGRPFGHHTGARALAVSADVLVAAGGTQSVSVFPLAGGPARRIDSSRQIQAVAIAPDGSLLTGAASGSIFRISADGEVVRLSPPDVTPPIWSVAVCASGVGASGDSQGAIRLWPDGRTLATLDGPVTGLAFTGGGRLLLACGSAGLFAWTVADGRLRAHVRTEPLVALAVAGNTAATLSDQLGLTRWRLRLV
jgi:WD40 repeat protein